MNILLRVQSLINLLHTLRCNLQITVTDMKAVSSLNQNIPPEVTVILTSNLTVSHVHNSRTCHVNAPDMFINTHIYFYKMN